MLRKTSISVSFVLMGLLASWAGGAIAQTETPATPPAELVELLDQIDTAASQQNVEAVMQYYSPNLTHSDGLTYTTLEQALSAFWEGYSDLTYDTELNSWEVTDGGIVAETTTTVTGTRETESRELSLNATITSRQRFEDNQIVEQEILSEQSMLTAGATPPTLDINLPEQVRVGREFNFDAIVLEPLGDRLLLGAAVEEPIRASGYLNPASPDLELLSAGGLFKVGRAPNRPDNRWISAIVVREDGITSVTQRLEVVGITAPSSDR